MILFAIRIWRDVTKRRQTAEIPLHTRCLIALKLHIGNLCMNISNAHLEYLDSFFVDKRKVLYHDFQDNERGDKQNQLYLNGTKPSNLTLDFSQWFITFLPGFVLSSLNFMVPGQEVSILQEENVCNLCLSSDSTRNPISFKNYIREMFRKKL